MPLHVTVESHIATITLDRPEVRNALDMETLDGLEAALVQLRDDPLAWVVILTGAGGAFSSGADLRKLPAQLAERGPDATLEIALTFHRVALAKPLLAAIEGPALGGGCELALACDLRVAASDARIGLPEARRGLLPAWGGTQRLPRLIGPARAKRMLFTGLPVDGEEAYRVGLVDVLAPPGGALERALELAAEICAASPSSVRLAKEAVDIGGAHDLEAGIRVEGELFERAVAHPDAAEGLASFLEKREPRWGRS